MSLLFEQDGVRFRYPENWQLEREDSGNGWTVTVQSPETAFLLVAYDESMPETEQVAETALQALREEYPDLEADPCLDSVAGQPAFGHDIRFFSLDLTNSCWTRSLYGSGGTILIMWQTNDLEMDTNGAVLRAMCSSLQVEEE